MIGLEQIGAQAYFQGPALLGALAALGLGVGVVTGMFGVGGAFLATPLMNVLLGIPYPVCVGSSLSFAIGTSVSGWARHVRLRNFEPRTTGLLGIGALFGVSLGAYLNGALAGAFGGGDSRTFTLTMDGMFIAILLGTAYLVVRRPAEGPERKALLQRLALPPRVRLPAAGLEHVSLPGILLVGAGIGVLNGLLGIGGGVMFVPVLILVVGLSPHQAVGTSLGAVAFNSVIGTVLYGLKGSASLWIVMALLVGSTLGVQVGAAICHRIHARRLKAYFAAIVVLAAVLVASDVFRKLVGS